MPLTCLFLNFWHESDKEEIKLVEVGWSLCLLDWVEVIDSLPHIFLASLGGGGLNMASMIEKGH